MKSFNRLFYLLLSLIMATTSTFAAGKLYNVQDYGATPSLTETCTEAIQAAIDAASADGGGTVLFPEGNYTTGTLFLKSNVTIKLEEYVEIFGSSDFADYADVPLGTEEPHFSKCLFFVDGQENITIIGHPRSEINGKGYMFKHAHERPKLFRIEECKNIKFEDVIFKNSGSWCVYFRECDGVSLHKCAIYNKENKNNDGMNYDGCSNVRITECNLQVEDDAICLKSSVDKITENIYVENCTVSSYWACLKFGTASKSGFRNVTVKNCQFFDSRHGTIKLLAVDGAFIENVLIENVDMYNCGGPIFLRLGNRARDYSESIKQDYRTEVKPESTRPVGTIRNITFRNVTARLTGRFDPPTEGIMFTGLPGHYIENVTMENVDFSYTGFGETGAKDNVIAEDEARYPEQLFFGVLPSYAMYIRHVKGLKMSNVNFSLRSTDDRHAIVMDDLVDAELSNITVDSTIGTEEAIEMKSSSNVNIDGLNINQPIF